MATTNIDQIAVTSQSSEPSCTQQEADLSQKAGSLNECILAPVSLRVRRYRQRHPRIDYFPAPDVLAIIEHHQAAGQEPCIAGIIDGLIRAGHKSVSGNGGRQS